ncbi:hypothetical protein SEA_CRACKLEWINK_67 [Mycobacterium phage Cracklewink]|uniref:DUF7736 domain-containing protein n=1 Tax=Mycobacterium phage Bipper TaxID=1805457 RepID=A0A142F2J6_9CAUD|nr:hypothetical protein KCH39_gp109 [Mycobacterium phage Bipper]AMQ67003.1 hypothetical protein SEA_BIPPER_68 [Mycobacterium phage Bipper]QDF19353.1 hypothetical protein SEA_CRACKLEWINK_67 [Mycobacterium phage Cracklewink]
MASRKEFPMATVLTVVTGKFLVPVAQVQQLVEWMTGAPVPPHQIRRAARECRDYLREQYGWMAGVSLSEEDAAKPEAFLRHWAKERGASMGVPQLPAGRYQPPDPIVDFANAGGFDQ